MKRIRVLSIAMLAGVMMAGWIALLTQEVGFTQPKKRDPGPPRRDPFALPPGIRHHSQETPSIPVGSPSQPPAEIKPAETQSPEPTFKLKAILIRDHVRLASIGRSLVTIGDTVEGEKVVEIRPDRVILEKEGKKRTLYLDQSPIQIKVEDR
ncbi:MAG: hypothetical protein N3G78_11635 [Desulfobacterota bacterium]|nr:hypothetical protein [Thermodesulfobacteriota bacterium]